MQRWMIIVTFALRLIRPCQRSAEIISNQSLSSLYASANSHFAHIPVPAHPFLAIHDPIGDFLLTPLNNGR